MIHLINLIALMSIIPMLLMMINFMMSKSTFKDREKISPFECGFDPISMNHIPFSSQFFTISMIFLIFDIEISILIPFIFLTKTFNLYMIITSFLFLFILTMGLYLEYNDMSIDWKI